MSRRGLFALLLHESRVAARQRQAAQRAAMRARDAAARQAQQAQRAEARATTALARASASDRKRLERENREAHVAAMEAEAEVRNLGLAAVYDEIDSLLAATLEIDDFVDLETLRIEAQHPPFARPELETPIPLPEPKPTPAQPVYVEPDAPTGLASLFGKRKHEALVAQAREAHDRAVRAWRMKVADISTRRQAALDAHTRAEAERVAQLVGAKQEYFKDCSRREEEASNHNRQLEALIANLGYGAPDAVQEYTAIVLANSVYPEHFSVKHEFEFDPSTAELRLRAVVPGPDSVPTVKAYRYTKSADEITSTDLSQKVCRDRYAGAVHQVALRSLHEVFECDRRGLIKTIALEVGSEAIDRATGRPIYVPFVVVAAERETFLGFDLAAVVPQMTLERLGAAVSKNPYGLVAVETKGVRPV